MEVAALGRPLFPGMLYDGRSDSFIPGVTLWDKKSLSEGLDSHPQPQTNVKFCVSDSLSNKFSLLAVSTSLKTSFLAGLVEVGGSGKFLRDTKSSKQQSRVTMFYRETTRYEQLTMSQLGRFTYPEVFDQKSATHVVVAVLYGAQAIMVFDRMISVEENKQQIDGELNAMVKMIPDFSTEANATLKMTAAEKKIACTFHSDVRFEQNTTTYKEALNLYKQLPALLQNPQNEVPIKVRTRSSCIECSSRWRSRSVSCWRHRPTCESGELRSNLPRLMLTTPRPRAPGTRFSQASFTPAPGHHGPWVQQQRKTRTRPRARTSPPPLPPVFEISTRNRFAPFRSIVRHVRATLAKGKVHTHCFPGAHVFDVSAQIPAILKDNQSVGAIVLHVGVNDIKLRQTEVLKRDFKSLIETVRSTSPATRIIVSGPLPTYRRGHERNHTSFSLDPEHLRRDDANPSEDL